jgi:nondiscriminating glutamyl-tRNA synthetase
MADSAAITRFAPSPTGDLHLGNARTALFSLLLARRSAGRFLLRIEDTDAARSREAHVAQLMDDLRWLGIAWDAGPDREDDRGPYLQSARGALYAEYFVRLERAGAIYPCFCTQLELEVARRTQAAAGKPPRYAATCRALTPEQRAARRAAGEPHTWRFAVPGGKTIGFEDFVHGPQRFASDDIGDFVVRRTDGTPAFFFCNAVDDAAMGVTHVLRGEDHLTNTPRQILILESLSLASPQYGHVSLIVGGDGAPLSKRHGAASVRDYRERGYLAAALVNHLFRLGHSCAEHGLLSLEQMARAFDPRHLGRAPARFDERQLEVWQKDAAHRLSADEARAWLAASLPAGLSEHEARSFIEAVLPNITLPEQARSWAEVVFGAPPVLASSDEELVRSAGPLYFSAGCDAAQRSGNDYAAIVAAIREATGKKGAELFKPLRLALTGRSHGPELAPLLKAMPPGQVRERLARFA